MAEIGVMLAVNAAAFAITGLALGRGLAIAFTMVRQEQLPNDWQILVVKFVGLVIIAVFLKLGQEKLVVVFVGAILATILYQITADLLERIAAKLPFLASLVVGLTAGMLLIQSGINILNANDAPNYLLLVSGMGMVVSLMLALLGFRIIHHDNLKGKKKEEQKPCP